ncbi:STM3941 family protein [Mucilaginibacter calamicampi]|uniref:STM3941 family protein n=1 Tax=Mucilaginibacter calamicampi TaxID=1302352 RepID=A0ABW2YYJ6_9SPHI
MIELKFYKSSLKALKLLLLASPFIAFSLFDIVNHANTMPLWFAWFSLCFFGLAIPVALFHLFDRRPQIIINELGIFDRMAYKEMVNWELVQDAYRADIHGQKFICIVLDEKAIPLLKGNKNLKNLSKAMGFQEVNLSLGQLKKSDQEKIEWLIINLMNADPLKRKQLMLDN